MRPRGATVSHAAARRISVKNTFLDVNCSSDSDGDAEVKGHTSGLRIRASSDPCLFDGYGCDGNNLDEDAEDADEIVMTGWDEAETDDETATCSAPLACYQHIAEDETNGKTFTIRGTSHLSEANGKSPVVKPERPVKHQAATRVDQPATANGAKQNVGTDLDNAKPGETLPSQAKRADPHWSPELVQQVERLVSENARLAEENRLLAVACREATTAAAHAATAASQHCKPNNFSTLAPGFADAYSLAGGFNDVGSVQWWNSSDGRRMCAMNLQQHLEQLQQQPTERMPHPSGEQKLLMPGQLRSRQIAQTSKWQKPSRGGVIQMETHPELEPNYEEVQGPSAGTKTTVEGSSTGTRATEEEGPFAGDKTTVMLRNLPNNYTRAMLLAMIDSEGFAGQYDFLYLPMDFNTRACLGYAFVNLATPAIAEGFWRRFQNYSNWVIPSRKLCYVSWSNPHQGLQANIERYKNSPVMHDTVPDDYKPILLKNSLRIAFPVSTKKLRVPRIRNFVEGCNGGRTFQAALSPGALGS